MAWASFTQYGSGLLKANQPFEGSVEVPDDADVNDLCLDAGVVVVREIVDITVSHLTAMADGLDEIILIGVPADAVVLKNGAALVGPLVSTEPGVFGIELAGKYRASTPITVRFCDLEQCWEELRAERKRLLAETDWAVLPDSPLSEEERQAYWTYRQALRDIPDSQASATLDTIVWPPKP